MTGRPSIAVILAAGKGTRMKSELEKVLHPLGGTPMLGHVLAMAGAVGFDQKTVVLGPQMDAVEAYCRDLDGSAKCIVQTKQDGTADAVLTARNCLEGFSGDVVVLYGDTPLLRPETVGTVRQALGQGADVVVLGFEARDPTGYGRLITNGDDRLLAIREEMDASPEERAITLCNSGVFGFRGEIVLQILDKIGNENAKGEFYLTDAVEIARADGLQAVAVACEEEEVLGINTRAELARAEAAMQQRLRELAMVNGATLIAPETVYLSADTVMGTDVVLEPHIVLGRNVTLEDGVTVKAFSHLEGAHVKRGATVGPFARLRPGAEIGEQARIGNFVEVKNATFEEGAKANHLAYVGDARVGAGANVGAGTITCNYDGFDKHLTDIGAGAFIGSNSALVAPVRIGQGAYVGSGSVITKDVADDALAVTRAPQQQREGWAAKVRARRTRKPRNKR